MARTCLAVVLAAGEGTRMKSSTTKVLHPVGNLPVIAHVMRAASAAGAGTVGLVVGREAETVEQVAAAHCGVLAVRHQTQRLGTADAVLAAADVIERGFDDVLVIYGDTPLIGEATLRQARSVLAEGADVAVIGFRTKNPHGYGRLIEQEGELIAIREHRDASQDERRIEFCNGGLMAISGKHALTYLRRIRNDNAKGEYYLTDIVEIARAAGSRVVAVEAPHHEVLGVDTRAGLAEAEAIWQRQRRLEMLLAGVSMVAPETVFLSHDTLIEADVLLEPNVVIGPGVTIRSGATIRSFSHLEGASVGAGCSVGPFARLRPEAKLMEGAKVGNFCEVKKAVVGEGAKINHLAYVGDADIGTGANIGAGAITCNYDGVNKHQTSIGAGTFVGSNVAMVAPVSIGANAYVASGSTVTHDIPDDALAFGRARQVNKENRGAELRDRLEQEKMRRRSDG